MANSPSVMHYFSWWLYVPNCLCIFIGELFPAKLLQCTNIWYYSIDLYSYFQISSHRHVSYTSIIEANSKIQAPSSIFHGTGVGLLEGQYDCFTTYLTVRIFHRLRKKKIPRPCWVSNLEAMAMEGSRHVAAVMGIVNCEFCQMVTKQPVH